jgi:hypothetical protein
MKMDTLLLLENTAALSISESWNRTLTVMIDRPLSAAIWKLEEMSGEKLLNELPPLQINSENILSGCN